jgi:hypothetical protein
MIHLLNKTGSCSQRFLYWRNFTSFASWWKTKKEKKKQGSAEITIVFRL